MTVQSRKALGVDDSNRYNRAIQLIVESGALITAAKVIEFTLFELSPTGDPDGLNAMYIVYEIIPQVTVSFQEPYLSPSNRIIRELRPQPLCMRSTMDSPRVTTYTW